MEKIFKQKNFNNFVWTPLGSRVNININFCLQVHFKVSAVWYCSHYLPTVSLTPVANLPPVSLIPMAICHRRPQVSAIQAELVAKFQVRQGSLVYTFNSVLQQLKSRNIFYRKISFIKLLTLIRNSRLRVFLKLMTKSMYREPYHWQPPRHRYRAL